MARTLHLRDLPEADLLQRLQALCSAHQEFTMLSKRYETASPIGDHPCPRFDDPIPPSNHCLPPRYTSATTPLEMPTLSRSHSHGRRHNRSHKHCDPLEPDVTDVEEHHHRDHHHNAKDDHNHHLDHHHHNAKHDHNHHLDHIDHNHNHGHQYHRSRGRVHPHRYH